MMALVASAATVHCEFPKQLLLESNRNYRRDSMLTVYRRHGLRCRQHSRRYRRCTCLCWVEGTLEGKYFRRSLKVRSWERAEKIIREMEEGRRAERITIEKSCEAFIQDAESRRLQAATVAKYLLLFRRLKEWAASEGIRFLNEIDLQT